MTPEVQFLAITKADGGLVIMQFITKGLLNAGGDIFVREASDENIEAEMVRAGYGGLSWRRIDPAEIPADRRFRDAWRDGGKKIDVDLGKAKEAHENRLRASLRKLPELSADRKAAIAGAKSVDELTAVSAAVRA